MKEGVFFIPYRDVKYHDANYIASLVPVVAGRGSSERILGYTKPDWHQSVH